MMTLRPDFFKKIDLGGSGHAHLSCIYGRSALIRAAYRKYVYVFLRLGGPLTWYVGRNRLEWAWIVHFSPAYKGKARIATQVGFFVLLVARCGALRGISSYRKCIHHARNASYDALQKR